jgi:hypothetical protein
MQNRTPIVQNYVRTRAWFSLVRDMTASAAGDVLTEFRAEVEAFVTWTEGELEVIDGFAKESWSVRRGG